MRVVGVDGPTASCANVELFKSNERAARMKFKRIAIDTSKHVFTIHGVDEQERPVLRRERGTHLGQRSGCRVNRPDT